MNDTTMGFMLEAIPINGANESIVEALDHMLRTKLPRGIPLCIHLMSSQLVGDRIEYGLREFSWSGEQAERFNAITRAYYMKAAATQFPLPEGMNLPLTLRHYRVFISYCSPSKKKSRADILEMENLVKIIRASLQGASITTQTVDAQAFIDIVGEMINHNPDSLYPKRRQLDPYSDLNYQCVEDSFDLKVRADYLTLGLRENGRNSTARILNFHLARNPEIAFLWNMADNYSNLLNPELSISCPFILTLTLVVEDQVKTHSEANLKYMDLEKKSKTSYAKWFPSVEKEAKEWGELRQRLGSGQSSVVSYFLNITAFCKDNNETALEVEQDILNSFRKNGFELISPRFNHMRNFLTCLPFMAGKGLFKQLKEAGVVQRAESFNVANLMPLVADNPLTPAGLLAPTYRNQLAFIDIFFRGMNNTNYNMAVCGTSGAGKTGLIQPLIRSVLDSGGFAVVFDMGDGYKSLCENMGGVYLDGETLRFNPFANITDIDQSAERVRDQLSVMASPNGTRDEIERLWNPQGMAAQPAQPAAGTSARTEKPAPRWFRLSNGRQVNLADWKVVLFMQGHCPYCHQFDPVLKQLAQQYGFSVFPYTLDGQGDTAFPEALPVPPDVMQTFFPNIPVATPTTFLVNVNTLEALPLLQGATDAAGFMARMDTVLQMYGGKKGAK